MSTIYKCDRCGKEMNKIHNRLKEVVIEGKLRIEGTKCFEPEILDLCEECYKDFKSFMFGPERDLDSKTTLRPWSEVGNPPKINGCKLKSCEQCEFDSISIDEEPCVSCGSGNNNFKPKGFYDACKQCKYIDFSWDEGPCSTCEHSTMSVGDDQSDNFESKEEEDSGDCTDTDDTLSEAKYKIGSYIQSVIVKDNIYKIMDIRLRDDGEFVYTVEDSSAGIKNLLWERVIDNWYTVIVKYSCEGCKLEGTDDCMCDTCIVGDPKGPRRQWWKPKEED